MVGMKLLCCRLLRYRFFIVVLEVVIRVMFLVNRCLSRCVSSIVLLMLVMKNLFSISMCSLLCYFWVIFVSGLFWFWCLCRCLWMLCMKWWKWVWYFCLIGRLL